MNYVAGGMFCVALVLIFLEYQKLYEYAELLPSASAFLNYAYIPMLVGLAFLVAGAFSRLSGFATAGFFGLAACAGVRVYYLYCVFRETIKSLSRNYYLSGAEEAVRRAYTILLTVLVTIAVMYVFFAIISWACPRAGKKPYTKAIFAMCVAILMVIVIAWAMISDLFGIKDELSSSTDGDVVLTLFGRLLMCLGIVFYFAWVAFPTTKRSPDEVDAWNTPNGMPYGAAGYPPYAAAPGYPPYAAAPQPPMPAQTAPVYPVQTAAPSYPAQPAQSSSPQTEYRVVNQPEQVRLTPKPKAPSAPLGVIKTASGSTLEFIRSMRTVCNGCGQEMICGEYRVIMPDGHNSKISHYCDSCVSKKTTQ